MGRSEAYLPKIGPRQLNLQVVVSVKLHHQPKVRLDDYVDAPGNDGDPRDAVLHGDSDTLAVNLWSNEGGRESMKHFSDSWVGVQMLKG